jgi:tetratricopeptide (TPR) repeat protein
MTESLPDDIYVEIVRLSKLGDELAGSGDFLLAKEKYVSALDLLPGDHREWEAATWLFVSIGDVHFQLRNLGRAFKCFINAVQCPNGFGNPYVHLRLGQLYFEQGNLDKAADELTRAYMGAGMDIFMEDDPKYLEFLETKITI